MFDLLIIGDLHHKNRHGLNAMLSQHRIKYKYGSENDIVDYQYIYCPSNTVDTTNYNTKKFIFGPHFSVFPTNKLTLINNVHNNSVYIQPSKWVQELWINMNADKILPVKQFAFPVDMQKFNQTNALREKVFIYFKRRKPTELRLIATMLDARKIEYKIFDYVQRYDEEDYLKYLQQCKYGIILDAHESQGFAIEEALSCNVPLLVWNTKYMSQEVGGNYNNIPCTTIPYWDERCGEYFYEESELEKTFHIFTNKLDTYKPREYIHENLSVDVCFDNFNKLYESL
jgi:glycosyltransferase involved in cell wall biosynthesis